MQRDSESASRLYYVQKWAGYQIRTDSYACAFVFVGMRVCKSRVIIILFNVLYTQINVICVDTVLGTCLGLSIKSVPYVGYCCETICDL